MGTSEATSNRIAGQLQAQLIYLAWLPRIYYAVVNLHDRTHTPDELDQYNAFSASAADAANGDAPSNR